MEKYMVAVLAAVLCASAYAAQNTELSNKQVRDPRYLETWLENNASDAQTRLAQTETGTITPTLVSNATLKVYGQKVEVVAGGTLVTPEATVDGKYAAVGGDASTGLMIQTGTCTNKQATVTFAVAFGAAPKVVLGWVEDVSTYSALTNTCISATAVGTTTFVPKTLVNLGGALTNMQYIAVGQRP
jgi:hypothetical protein